MTQKELIIKYIEDFGSISSYEAYIDLGITQLATRIKELKAQGFVFTTEWVKSQNRYGKSIKYKKYTLRSEVS